MKTKSSTVSGTLLVRTSICSVLIALAWPGWSPAADTTTKPRASIYDKTADGVRQIEEAVASAGNSDEHVLLQFGGDWCVWCVRLHNLFETNKAISQTLKSNYVVVHIDYNDHNKHLATKYRAMEMGLPFLVILDGDGKHLATKDTAELEQGDHHDPEKVLAFLKQWTPEAYEASETELRTKPIAHLVQQYLQKPPHADSSMQFEHIRSRGGEAAFALVDIIRAGKGTNHEQSIQAYRILGALGPRARSAVPFLISQFTTNNDLVQFTAAALPELGPEAQAVVPELANILRSSDLNVVVQERAERSDARSWLLFNAAHCLAKLDPAHPQLVPTLLVWLKSPNVFCRRAAPTVLAELGPAGKSALPALREAAGDADETVRQKATCRRKDQRSSLRGQRFAINISHGISSGA